jgi:hypothetical protein
MRRAPRPRRVRALLALIVVTASGVFGTTSGYLYALG